MPRLTPARAQAQRARVLEAALRCFAKDGFQGATMQDIVRESGLSPGAIYGYFASKSEIFAAIAAQRHLIERQRIKGALASGDAPSSLTRLVDDFSLTLHDPKDATWRRLAVQLWAESFSDQKIRRETRKGVYQAIKLLVPIIDGAKQDGRWSSEIDAAALARVMIAVLQGISLQLAWDKSLDLPAIVDAVHELLTGPRRLE